MSSDCSHAMNNVVEHPFLHCSATHPLAVALLELAHLGGLLHTEVDLVRVLPDHLQLDVLSLVSHVAVGFALTGVFPRWRLVGECRELGKRAGRRAA